ncbi:Gag-pol Polyprotein [Phytophthora megakarya]|uniref:Gag-pol Polyprotein n=1 Tax=Phytophthora megakarya TaxID=4795 RepID=A0A225VQF7_9STRA|nr:Gag-pol Polyprotein [Phytophthora megakarya]
MCLSIPENIFESLLEWFASFGVCRVWVSDQGIHFTSKNDRGSAACANGTVEVVNRDVLRYHRALLSDWRMQPPEWPCSYSITSIRRSNSYYGNDGPRGHGFKDNFAIPGVTKSATVDEIKSSQQAQVVKVQEALEVMHKQSNRFNTSLRAVARSEHAKKKRTNTEQFDSGGFMLNADV